MRKAIWILAVAGLLAAGCSPRSEPVAQASPAEAAPADAASAPLPTPTFVAGDPAALNDASTPRDIHNALIIPGSEAMFAAENAAPTTDQEWADLHAASLKVIQGAELMKTGSRPQGRAEWIAAADAVIANAKLGADDVAKKTTDNLVFTDGDMMGGCTSCHQKFRFTVPATATEPAH